MWIAACKTEDVDADDVIGIRHDGLDYAIFRSPEDEYYATAGHCTHERELICDGLVMDGEIECPKHLGRFNYASGAAQGAPNTSLSNYNLYNNHITRAAQNGNNWFKDIFKPALIQNHNISVSGGTGKSSYFMAFNYMDQQGLFATSNVNPYNTNAGLKRYVLNSKIDIDVNKDFNVGLQLFGRLQDGIQPGAGTATWAFFTGRRTKPTSRRPAIRASIWLGVDMSAISISTPGELSLNLSKARGTRLCTVDMPTPSRSFPRWPLVAPRTASKATSTSRIIRRASL